MGKKIEYTWFAEPLDDDTNRVIAECLQDEASTSTTFNVLCSDGKRRNLWSCSFPTIAKLQNSKEGLKLRFKVFVQVGKGKIKHCPHFLLKKKKKQKRS